MMTLLAWRLDSIHFIYHLYPSTWIWRIVTHENVLWSYLSHAIVAWNCYLVFIYIILYFWLFLPKIHHSPRSYHWLLFLVGVSSFVALIKVLFHSHCYASSVAVAVTNEIGASLALT